MKINSWGKVLIVFIVSVCIQTVSFCIEPINLQKTTLINSGDSLTLQDCIDIALKNSPTLKQYKYNWQIAKHDVSIAKAQFTPYLSAGAGYNQNFNSNKMMRDSRTLPSVNARLNELIFDFGKTFANIKMEKFLRIVAEYNYNQEVINTIYNIKCKYYAVLAAKAIVDIDKANVQINERNYQRTKAYFDEGIRSKIDLVNAEVYLSDSKINLVNAQKNYKDAIVALNNAMYVAFAPEYTIQNTESFNFEHNYLPVNLIQITDYSNISNLPEAVYNATLTTTVQKTEVLKDYVFQKYPYSFEESVNLAYDNRQDLKSLKATKNAMEQYLLYVKREYYPSLSASAGYGFVNHDLYDNNSFDIAVEVNSSLNPVQTKHKIDNAKLQVSIAQNNIDELMQNIYFNIQKTYIDMIAYEEQIPLNETKVRQTLENLELADGRYEVGLGDFIEVQDAKVNYNNAQNIYIQTVYNYNVSRATLEKEISLEKNSLMLGDYDEGNDKNKTKRNKRNSKK